PSSTTPCSGPSTRGPWVHCGSQGKRTKASSPGSRRTGLTAQPTEEPKMNFPSLLVALTMLLPLPEQGGGRVGPDTVTGGMVRVPAGSYLPHYSRDRQPVAVAGFEMDRFAVTREEYLAFVTARPAWRASEVKPIFADAGYLADWRDDLDFGD